MNESEGEGGLYSSIHGLIQEKQNIDEEESKIKKNKNLTFLDKYDAVKSARSLSKTIDGLIGREKERLSGYFESQLNEEQCLSQNSQRENANY